MRLSELIRERKDVILQEFEDFARTHTLLGASMNVEALRDHASRMLDAMALDLDQPQTHAEQQRKGRGDAPRVAGAPRTAAEEHGVGRAQSGFSLEETFAEYRALRASVMRHYVAERGHPDVSEVQDVIRFNEAMDQALAEAITEYAQAVTRYREMFLAVLGHDLRSPLGGILVASTFLAEEAGLSGRNHRLAATIAGSARQMNELVEAMLEYTSSQLGQDLRLRRTRADLADIAGGLVQETEMSHPRREIRLSVRGDVVGDWDVHRVRQIVSNLVSNAVKHGSEDTPINVSVSGDEPDAVVVAVYNAGAPIPEPEWELIFEPFRHGSSRGPADGQGRGSMGLGLYIARRMAEAHGGTVRVESSGEAGTTFSVRLPRRPPAPSPASGEDEP